jgi:small subunit ribosomal protein S17
MKTRKQVRGLVTSDAMDKTITVAVNYLKKHPKYKKYIKRKSVYKAHDPENKCKAGDMVTIEETRPLSKTKRWKLVSILNEE